jgi:hypothetical protein
MMRTVRAELIPKGGGVTIVRAGSRFLRWRPMVLVMSARHAKPAGRGARTRSSGLVGLFDPGVAAERQRLPSSDHRLVAADVQLRRYREPPARAGLGQNRSAPENSCSSISPAIVSPWSGTLNSSTSRSFSGAL